MKFRPPFAYDVQAASVAAGLECKNPSKTDQSFKESADINIILERFGRGEIVQGTAKQAMYADISDVPTNFSDLQMQLVEAREAFQELPSKIRDLFGQDPAVMFEWLGDPKNHEEAAKLGLLPELAQSILDVTVPGDTKPKTKPKSDPLPDDRQELPDDPKDPTKGAKK